MAVRPLAHPELWPTPWGFSFFSVRQPCKTAVRLARREGVEFLLDPLWQKINDDLHEHIDGLYFGLPRPRKDVTSPIPLVPAALELDLEERN